MNEEAFLDLLLRFSRRPMPAMTGTGRHVYVWHGGAERLVRSLPGEVGRTLDLHALATSLPQAPRAVDDARRLLLRAIRDRLSELATGEGQKILVVTGCDLLSRYHVSLAPFFEQASERMAVVFGIPLAETRFQPPEPLPEYVTLNPRAPLDYFRGAAGRDAVIDTIEELS